jgi:hypothetical protein
MKRSRTHQIDALAQRYFKATIPVTWTPNEQKRDYGKDYLVEPGDDDGEQTGLKHLRAVEGTGGGQVYRRREPDKVLFGDETRRLLP